MTVSPASQQCSALHRERTQKIITKWNTEFESSGCFWLCVCVYWVVERRTNVFNVLLCLLFNLCFCLKPCCYEQLCNKHWVGPKVFDFVIVLELNKRCTGSAGNWRFRRSSQWGLMPLPVSWRPAIVSGRRHHCPTVPSLVPDRVHLLALIFSQPQLKTWLEHSLTEVFSVVAYSAF